MTIIKKNVSDGTIYEFLMTSEGRKTMLFTEKKKNLNNLTLYLKGTGKKGQIKPKFSRNKRK